MCALRCFVPFCLLVNSVETSLLVFDALSRRRLSKSIGQQLPFASPLPLSCLLFLLPIIAPIAFVLGSTISSSPPIPFAPPFGSLHNQDSSEPFAIVSSHTTFPPISLYSRRCLHHPPSYTSYLSAQLSSNDFPIQTLLRLEQHIRIESSTLDWLVRSRQPTQPVSPWPLHRRLGRREQRPASHHLPTTRPSQSLPTREPR